MALSLFSIDKLRKQSVSYGENRRPDGYFRYGLLVSFWNTSPADKQEKTKMFDQQIGHYLAFRLSNSAKFACVYFRHIRGYFRQFQVPTQVKIPSNSWSINVYLFRCVMRL